MCTFLRVRWTITPRIPPQPWIACRSSRPFQSSGRIRLNANGKRLDAWLIYKCVSCEKTWNRPLFERRNVRDIDPLVLDAMHRSDPDWVRCQEFDIEALRRRTQQIEECVDFDVNKEALAEGGPSSLEIELQVPLPMSLRLDRLLTVELGLSRSRLHTLYDEGRLRVTPERKDVLRRRIRNGMRIIWEGGT